MKKVKLYDTTLRDGAQGENVSFSLEDKLRIAQKLDALGIHYIEGGWPGSNPKDAGFFKEVKKIALKNAQVTAFGSTRRARQKAEQDNNIKHLLKAETEVITIFGKSWDFQVSDILRVGLEENLMMISDSVSYLKKQGRRVFYDAEHFFDGFCANKDYALKTLAVAQDAGADYIVLCETNGGMISSEIAKIVAYVKSKIKISLGIHTHNDCGMAVSNAITAVEQGCVQVQGTINGYGERCGNADLCVIIPNLKLKLGIDCISDENLKKLAETAHYIAEIANMIPQNNQPFVGKSAFAHKGGVHIDGVIKNAKSYEQIEPGLVGNRRRFLLSELSGKTNILVKAKELNLDLNKNDPQTKKILELLQDLENQGYQFEAAGSSFELLMNKAMGKYKDFFKLENFSIVIEKKGKEITSKASVQIRVNEAKKHSTADGDGPVNALDNALRKALTDFYPVLAEMHLSDFKVRVLNAKEGTAAKVRVLIQSQDKRDTWDSVGVSENIIEASWQALRDSMEYKLWKEKVVRYKPQAASREML
ncbi:MAG: citramalate synthase [Candidatus Omnitrophica bacterium]|nr:citramalate synthase [Candidatus Omnitrophota bacterium]